ncbi:hypothetical protein [Kamptonema sp. UHCC 0994]|uniref:hypothetical protein n=1 Tax=Kamptonema sp. UHCC 0994 TaxID=3031329 RepID=UPI0023B88907|nr:hypothetical protein [Kamptonema sp. UHCC 0994]MDF0551691.1 hypothetical protein [Kamptonema sp. UHCC 0994]
MTLESFRIATYKKMAEEEASTIINQQKATDDPLRNQPLFDVYELLLNQSNKDERLFLSGSEPFIPLQTSLLKATELIVDWRVNWSEGNFKKWAKAFEDGFIEFQTDSSSELKKLWTKQPWPGIEKANRPKIVEIKVHGNRKARPDFKVVQFFENRQILQEWLIFSGSYSGIAAQIINWWNQKAGEGANSGKSDVIKRSGHPEVTLYFRQESDFEKGFQPVQGKISFDLMELTDNPSMTGKGKFKLITEKDISNLGKKISSIFRTKPPYTWSKGKKQVAYHDWGQGYNFLIYCSTHEEGERLANAVLSIQGHKLDEAFLKQGEAKSPEKAYPPPKEITVMGYAIAGF